MNSLSVARRRPRQVAIALLLMTGAASLARSQQKGLPALIESASKALVRVVSIDAKGSQISRGSGFIMSDGRVVTNAHVVKGAAEARVYDHDGFTLASFSYLECLSLTNDIAIFPPATDPPGSLSLVPSDPPVGEAIVTLGAPLDLPNTASEGIVSAHRETTERHLLQITSPVSPGSSGGPVLNLSGKVVGMVVALMEGGQNLNFAIPASELRAAASRPAVRVGFSQDQATSTAASIPTLHVDSPVSGEFSMSDKRYGTKPGIVADGYLFEATAGEPLIVGAFASIPFDLMITTDDATVGVEDKEGMKTERTITFKAPRSGSYVIFLVTKEPNQTGNYIVGFTRVPEPKPSDSSGDEWVRISSDSRDRNFYVNLQVQDLGGGRRGVWTEMRLHAPERVEGSEKMRDSTLNYWEVDCRSRLVNLAQSIDRLDEEIVSSSKYDQLDMQAVPPRSIASAVIDRACAR